MTDYRPRDIAPLLLEALSQMPVVVLSGMRQTGKSTLLRCQPELQDRRYESLDDFAALEAARANPDAFTAGAGPLSIDEAQRAPELLLAIKRDVDRNREPGRFLLTGSANFLLLQTISETLAGRALYLTLWPFSHRELLSRTQSPPALRVFWETGEWPEVSDLQPVSRTALIRGGMPALCTRGETAATLWFQGYEQTYLERDVRSLSQVADLVPFRQVLHLAALRTGQVLNVSELARDAKVPAATTARYLSLMETSCVIARVPPYLGNRTSRLVKSPKIYVCDSGLAAHLCGIQAPDELERDPLSGALLETYVAQNLSATISARWLGTRLYYWHVQGRHEVDFVVEAGRECLAVEVKSAARWGQGDLSGLRAFLSATPHCRAGVLAYMGDRVAQLGERLWAVPLGLLLS